MGILLGLLGLFETSSTDIVPCTAGKDSVYRKLRWAPEHVWDSCRKRKSLFWELHPCPTASSQSLNWLIDSRKRRARKRLYMSKNNRTVVDDMHILLWLWGTNRVWETVLYNESTSLLRSYSWRFHLQNQAVQDEVSYPRRPESSSKPHWVLQISLLCTTFPQCYNASSICLHTGLIYRLQAIARHK